MVVVVATLLVAIVPAEFSAVAIHVGAALKIPEIIFNVTSPVPVSVGVVIQVPDCVDIAGVPALVIYARSILSTAAPFVATDPVRAGIIWLGIIDTVY